VRPSPSATSRSSQTARSTARRAAAGRLPGWPLLHDRGELPSGGVLRHRSIVDGVFLGRVVEDGPPIGDRPTVVTEVTGSAYRTGRHVFELDPDDPLGTGFLLR
jgi:proline racemase